jgi:alkaline phosphatase D
MKVAARCCSAGQGDNLAPCFGLQFFGRVDIDGASSVMTVTLKDLDNCDLWSIDIEPKPGARRLQHVTSAADLKSLQR